MTRRAKTKPCQLYSLSPISKVLLHKVTVEKTFTLILPTLNEIEALRVILPQILECWSEKIILVDGGSHDGTPEYALSLGVEVLQQTGAGIPNAEKEAFAKVTTDYFVLFTPDGNSIPERLPELRTKTLEGYDMVIASRYKDGGVSEDDDIFTGFGNKLFTGVINLLFRAAYTDTLVGFRAISCAAIRQMRLPQQEEEGRWRQRFYLLNSWEVASCTRAAKLKLKVAEIRADEPKRIGGVRKLSIIKNGCACVLQILFDFLFFRPPQQSAK
jgi:glycosyltransferase involved in cell wall biosynthesis